ncbi:Dynein regulatory complex subunit 5 (Flagellar-associated protein 155), partial [Durusdinium trenchii]
TTSACVSETPSRSPGGDRDLDGCRQTLNAAELSGEQQLPDLAASARSGGRARMAAEAGIGSTTNAISVADELRQFKQRVVLGRENGRVVSEEEAAEKRARQQDRVASLKSFCLKCIADNFDTHPEIKRVPEPQVPALTAMLSTSLDIEVASAHIYDENYWKRRAKATKWKHFEIAHHGMTWKQLYLERRLEELLEGYVPGDEDQAEGQDDLDALLNPDRPERIVEETLLAHLRASQDYVFGVRVGQLLSHLDHRLLFDSLPNLTRLELTYGVKRVGMQYERSLFGMKMPDATSLASAIQRTSTLTSLSLPCNLIDDDMARMLMTGLISNCTVTQLNLSHNKITNHGVRLIAKLLGPKSVLTSLDLCDNQIHVEGGRYLSRALRHNSSLMDLNLRLNRLTDEGGRLLIEGLSNNSTLGVLNVGSNSLGSKAASALCAVLAQQQTGLFALNMSCNELDEEDGQGLVATLRKSCPILSLDVRKNHFNHSTAAELNDIVKRSELELRSKEGKF